MISPGNESRVSRFELGISYLLIFGVIASLILTGIGMVLFYIHFGQVEISGKKAVLLQEQNSLQLFLGLLKGGQGQDKAIWLMTLGIAILILTPYARVIMSVLHFIKERDLKYTLINLFVFLLITFSLILR